MSVGLTRRGLLRPGTSSPAAPAVVAAIGEACLAGRGIVCRTCGDACPERAIRFPPLLGRAALPVLSLEACTGCGDCLPMCPVAAIALSAAEAAHAV